LSSNFETRELLADVPPDHGNYLLALLLELLVLAQLLADLSPEGLELGYGFGHFFHLADGLDHPSEHIGDFDFLARDHVQGHTFSDFTIRYFLELGVACSLVFFFNSGVAQPFTNYFSMAQTINQLVYFLQLQLFLAEQSLIFFRVFEQLENLRVCQARLLLQGFDFFVP
jgi:hypothetical protein